MGSYETHFRNGNVEVSGDMEVEIVMEMEVEVELIVDIQFKKHGRGATVFNKC